MVESPCVNVCKLNADFVCIGCGRTMKEVMDWPTMTGDERQRVLDRVFSNE